MKRNPLVIANWKMHGQKAWIEGYVREILNAQSWLKQCETALCPPFVYLAGLADSLRQSSVKLGAQNLHDHDQGAFTGEVSARMLKDLGCSYAVVGHSERRTLFAETDVVVAFKFEAVRRNGLVPILCVGEDAVERANGLTEQVIKRQLDAVLELSGAGAFAEAVVAYEPIWAIGTGNTATPAMAQDIHWYIRQHIARHHQASADKVRILYGGSVKAENAEALAKEQDIDGALVGGASLVVKEFLAICAGFNG